MDIAINKALLNVIESDPRIARISDRICPHPAFSVLAAFGRDMKAAPLDGRQRKVLLASLWAFFEQFPTGILALSIRACDEWAKLDPWGATAKGANVLFADVDEYGLNNVADRIYQSHHQMFLAFANHLGVRRDDLLDAANIVDGAHSLGSLVAELYRHSPLGSGLGVHFASELVASVEFAVLFEGFTAHCGAYNFESSEDPALAFVRIHTDVEPMHLAQNCELIKSALQEGLIQEGDIVASALKYLDQFRRVYSALRRELFDSTVVAREGV